MSSDAVRPKQPRDFDPVSFTVVTPRRFEDLRVGDVFRAPSRTLTDARAAAFQTVSADNHPIHYDVEYARRHGHIAPVVHGLQARQRVAKASFTRERGAKGDRPCSSLGSGSHLFS